MKTFHEYLQNRDPELYQEILNEAQGYREPAWKRFSKKVIAPLALFAAGTTAAGATGATKAYGQQPATGGEQPAMVQTTDSGGDPLKNFADEGDDTVAAFNPKTGKFERVAKEKAIMSNGRWEVKTGSGGVDPLTQFAPDPDEGKGTVDPAVVKMVQLLGQNADSVVKTFYKTGSQYKGIVDKAVGAYLDKIEDPKAKKSFATKMANHLLSNQVELSTSMVEKLIDAGLPAHFNDELLNRAQNSNWKNSYISKSLIPKLAAQKVGDFVNDIKLLDKEGNIDQNKADEVASQLVKMYTQKLPYDQNGEILDSMLPEIKKMSIFSRMAPQFVNYLIIEKGAVPESEWYNHPINGNHLAVLLKHKMISPDSAAWFGRTHTYENMLADHPEAAKELYDLASKSKKKFFKNMPKPTGHQGLDSLHRFVNKNEPDARDQVAKDADAMQKSFGKNVVGAYQGFTDFLRNR